MHHEYGGSSLLFKTTMRLSRSPRPSTPPPPPPPRPGATRRWRKLPGAGGQQDRGEAEGSFAGGQLPTNRELDI